MLKYRYVCWNNLEVVASSTELYIFTSIYTTLTEGGMPVNPCDCNFKICYRVTNGVTSELGSVFLTISVILLSKYMSSKMFCPLLLIPRTANVFKRFYYWAIRSESLWKAAYQDLQGTHCGGRHHSKLKVFKISRRPSHPTVTFIFETPIFTLVNSQNK